MNVLVVEKKIHKKKIIEAIMKVNHTCYVCGVCSCKEAKKKIKQVAFDILFINTEPEAGCGVAFAKEVRDIYAYKFIPIVFITEDKSLEYEAFHNIHCYEYITRPYYEQDFIEILKNMLVEYDSSKAKEKFLKLSYRGDLHKIAYEDILYIEKRNRKIVIITNHKEITYKCMSIKEFMEELDTSFVQVHKSIIVHKNKVSTFNYHEKTLNLKELDINIPVGGSFINVVHEIFDER